MINQVYRAAEGRYEEMEYRRSGRSGIRLPEIIDTPIDYLGELDSLLSNLDESDLQALNSDVDFINLNNSVQQIVQAEIINNIKWKVNSNPVTAESVSKLKTIINNVRRERESEQRRSMSELNDYIQNYSDMTFNEYKKIKSIRDESK